MNNKKIEKEKILKTIVDNSTTAVMVTDFDGTICYLNSSFKSIFGYPIKNFIGKNSRELFSKKYNIFLKEDVEFIFAKFIKVLKEKKDGNLEYRILSKDKKIKWIYHSWKVVLKDKKRCSVISNIVDITDRKEMEKNLKDSEEKFKTLVEGVAGMFYKANSNWNTEYVIGSKSISGYTENDFKTNKINWLDIIHPDDKAKVFKDGYKLSKKKMSINQEYRIINKNKKIVWVLDKKSSIFENGKLKYIIGFVSDINEKKIIEEKLKISENRYRRLFETAKDAIFILNADTGKIIDANPYIQDLLGYSKKEFIGKKMWQISPFKDIMANKAKFLELQKNKYVRYEDLPLETKKGKKAHVEFVANVYSIGSGKKVIQCNIRDITDRKKAEDKLKKSEEMYRKLFDSMYSGVAIYKVSSDGNKFYFKDFNKRAEKIEGVKKEEIIDKEIRTVFPGAIKMGIIDVLKEVYKTNRAKNIVAYEYIDKKTGKKYYRDNFIFKISTGDLVVIYEDVTNEVKTKKDLEESEEKYRNLVERANDGIAIIQDGKMKYVNPRLSKILDYSVKSILDTPFMKYIHKSELENVIKNYKNRLSGKKFSQIYESALRNKNGKKIDVEFNIGLIKYNNKPAEIAIIRDISERKMAEEKLIESEEKYRNLVERAADGVLIVQDGKIKYANPKLVKFIGYSYRDILNTSIINYLPKSQKEIVLKRYKDRILGKKVVSLYESALVHKNGKILPIEINAGIINFKGKKADLVIIRDILERKKREVELREKVEEVQQEKEKIDTIIRNVGDGLFMVDSNLRIVLFNKKASEISGISEKDAIGKKYTDVLKFVYEKDEEKINDSFLKDVIKTCEERLMVNHTLIIDKNGKKIPVTNSAAPIKDKKGNFIGCVVVFRDVSKEREINKMKSEFVSIASHQLKTPLTGIKWMSELLLREKLNAREKEYTNDIHKSTLRLTKLIEDLLDVSHIETGRKFDIIKKKTDIKKIIKEILTDNKSLIKDRKIANLKLKGFSKQIILNVDEEKIKQVFNNVITNAIKYSKRNGNISIEHMRKNGEHLFKIKDDGVGIPKHQQKRVFEKFFRADNAIKSESDGTGLGLFIAKAILEAHNGKIWFKSVEKKGATFYIKLFK